MDFLVHHLLRSSADRAPDKEALVHGGERLSYAELLRRATAVAHGLGQADLEPGDRLGIYLEASVPQVVSIFAASRRGAVWVPINHQLLPDQVVHIANDCRMRGLIVDRRKLDALRPVLARMPSLEFLVVVGETATGEGGLPVHSFAELAQLAAPANLPEAGIGNDLTAILYTSGSTGRPKGVMLSHAQVMAGSSIVSTYLGITSRERILAVLPFSFDAGLNQLMTSIEQGGTCVLINFLFAREIVQALLRERITGLAGVPTVWSLLAQPSSTMEKHTFPDLRYITNTGGRMPQSVLAILRRALPTTQVFLMYGLTEAFRSTYLPPAELDRRPTSMGKAIPNTEILVVNEEGRLCKPGEPGELVHRGPTVSLGYWGQPELTAERLRPHPFAPPELGNHERVCYSGDVVTMDEDGFLYFVGRRDAMIKSSGYRISPTEVEEALFQSGRLRGAAAIGIPDEMLGQIIKVFVVPREGESVTADELREFTATRLPHYMVPKILEVVPDLPKTPTGKVDYPALRRREGLA
jgi:acyl-CoA ligase (AMP-forming) (exosortase A-associated)